MILPGRSTENLFKTQDFYEPKILIPELPKEKITEIFEACHLVFGVNAQEILLIILLSSLDNFNGEYDSFSSVIRLNLFKSATTKDMVLQHDNFLLRHIAKKKFDTQWHKHQINTWRIASHLFHELLHHEFHQKTILAILSKINLDKKLFITSETKKLPSYKWLIHTIFIGVKENETLNWQKYAEALFQSRVQNFGEEYAVLGLFNSYLTLIEEYIFETIDKYIIDNKTLYGDYAPPNFSLFLRRNIINTDQIKQHYRNNYLYFQPDTSFMRELQTLAEIKPSLEIIQQIFDTFYSLDAFATAVTQLEFSAETKQSVDKFTQNHKTQIQPLFTKLQHELTSYLRPHEISITSATQINEWSRDHFWYSETLERKLRSEQLDQSEDEVLNAYSLITDHFRTQIDELKKLLLLFTHNNTQQKFGHAFSPASFFSAELRSLSSDQIKVMIMQIASQLSYEALLSLVKEHTPTFTNSDLDKLIRSLPWEEELKQLIFKPEEVITQFMSDLTQG